MENLRKLLRAENSELGRLVKFNLNGLQAALKQALTELTNDPEVKLCEDALEELNNLLQSKSSFEDKTQSPIVPANANSSFTDAVQIIESPRTEELKLVRLQKEFNSDKQLASYLRNTQLESQIDSDLWNEVQRKLLRVTEELAEHWRQQALAIANEVGAQEDTSNCISLPFNKNENIFPGLKGSIKAQGFMLLNPSTFTSTNCPVELKK